MGRVKAELVIKKWL